MRSPVFGVYRLEWMLTTQRAALDALIVFAAGASALARDEGMNAAQSVDHSQLAERTQPMDADGPRGIKSGQGDEA